jgi:endonuclease/exonuclease/phosphatase (EEP) superfamily protein YafD
MQKQQKLINWLNVIAWVYFTLIFAWAAAHFILGDYPWWLFAFNALSFYFFVPLPFVVLMALFIRRRETWVGVLLVFLLGLYLYGWAYLPWRTVSTPVGQPLTVMTYNVLGHNEHPEAVVEAIRASGADVVGLQELNPRIANAIRDGLSSLYPYQEFDAQNGVTGSGAISRYPLRLTDETMPGSWVGTPQILSLTFGGQIVTVLNLHPFATNIGTPEVLELSISERERQARAIRDFALAHSEPVLVTTDLNATAQNTAYKLVTSTLTDSWMEAGWGPGLTFPGGISRKFIDVDVPTWAIRIDYVFHSSHFRAIEAHIGPWDGWSDHRPVVAKLVLVGQ